MLFSNFKVELVLSGLLAPSQKMLEDAGERGGDANAKGLWRGGLRTGARPAEQCMGRQAAGQHPNGPSTSAPNIGPNDTPATLKFLKTAGVSNMFREKV